MQHKTVSEFETLEEFAHLRRMVWFIPAKDLRNFPPSTGKGAWLLRVTVIKDQVFEITHIIHLINW